MGGQCTEWVCIKKMKNENRQNSVQKRVGLVIIYTGNGKGKTTAAMGLLLRAWGRGMKVAAIQFIKDKKSEYGESLAAKRMGIEIMQVGDGCTWQSQDMEKTIHCALEGWEIAKTMILKNNLDVVILDEFTHTLHFGWLDTQHVINWFKENKPERLYLVITGRNAPRQLIDYADLVTEMKEIKHPYKDKGLLSQHGVDY